MNADSDVVVGSIVRCRQFGTPEGLGIVFAIHQRHRGLSDFGYDTYIDILWSDHTTSLDVHQSWIYRVS